MKLNDEQIITDLLHNMGIPSHLKGYKYIFESINILLANDTLIKDLYSVVSLKYEVKITLIERLIRYAIEKGFNHANYQLMIDIFGDSLDINKAVPTNKVFLVTITNVLKLKLLKKVE